MPLAQKSERVQNILITRLVLCQHYVFRIGYEGGRVRGHTFLHIYYFENY